MARTKSSRSTSTRGNSVKASGKSASTGTRKSASRSGQQDQASSEESLSSQSFSRAREFVDANTNLQTAGIALAGAGILALVSTQAGRSLIKTATDAVVSIVTERYQQFAGQQDEADTNTTQRPSRQRDQARI